MAHSLYKTHAFLSSGSVLDSAARSKTSRYVSSGRLSLAALPAAVAAAALLTGGMGWMSGIDFTSKPSAAVLGLILAIALTQLVWHALATGGISTIRLRRVLQRR